MTALNHLNLSTSDVAALADFFQQVFSFRVVAERGAGNFVVMMAEDGFILTLLKDKSLQKHAYPGGFHVGFLQPDRETVMELHARIEAIGIPVRQPVPMRGETFGFYVQAPGGVLVEVSSA